MTATERKERLQAAIAKLGLSIKAEFVPWSKSRNAGEKCKSLNWRVTLLKGARQILTTDYSAGEGHCPSYEQGNNNACRAMAIDAECETGYAHLIRSMNPQRTANRILPDTADVIHSLVSDSDVIEYATFEDWASELGYDPDSRKGEAIYRLCLEHALALRNAIGEDGIQELREAGLNY